ncbi:MAG: YbaY family lipoprotein [Parvibaculaceae bacterium]
MKSGHSRLALSRRKLMGLAGAALALPVLPALAAGRTLRGRVTYRERIALPPEALLEVRLLDVSLADAPARSLAVTRVKTRHRMPIPYRLRLDDAKIQRGRTYALQARITVRGKLWFITTTRHTVFGDGPDETDIRVELVKSASAAPLAPGGRWRAEAIRNRGVAPDFTASIEIAADGKVTGTGGCNRISGKATVAGAHMSFGPIISTKMACAPSVMDQESNFLAALADTRLWRIDETRDKLILVDAHGVTVLRLARM